MIPVGGFSVPNVVFLCNTAPIRTLHDLEGKRIRLLAGGVAGGISQALDVTPVGLPATDLYQALERGQIDCAGITLTYLNIDMQLHEVVKCVTLINLPPTFTDPIHIYDVEFWQSLTDDQRRTIFDVSAEAMANMRVDYADATARSLAFAKEAGIEVVEPADDVKAAIAAFAATIPPAVSKQAETLSIDDPDGLYAKYEGHIRKWEALIGGMANKNDPVELTGVLRTNIFDTLDISTYGMN